MKQKVVCLNWKNYLGKGALYVDRLHNMVARHLTIPFQFIEVTERDLPLGREGWFNKLFLLEMFDGDVMYLDLDLIISRNIDHLVLLAHSDRSKIWARDDWSYPVTNPTFGREATINSSVLLWCGRKDMSGVTQERIANTHGDQGILTQLFWPKSMDLLPNKSIASWKYDVLQDRGYGDVCVFHGQPKNHELLENEFVRLHWR